MGLDGIDRIKRGMVMPRELDVAVQGDAVDQLEQLAAAQRDHLFGCGEAAVVAHDAAGVAHAQQHVGLLEKTHLRPGFPG